MCPRYKVSGEPRYTVRGAGRLAPGTLSHSVGPSPGSAGCLAGAAGSFCS
jgi:hypothetical protein